MICRHWRGIAKHEYADPYVAHLRAEIFPALRGLEGFRGAAILRRPHKEGVEFLVITRWDSEAAIRAFAGDDLSTAVVPDKVAAMMVEFDETASHYEFVE
jgi:heme-degrading monooxygenase HmoA